MTHYEKLATMIFRIIGIFFLVLAVLLIGVAAVFILIAFFDPFMRTGEVGITILIIYTIPITIIGFTVFKFSKKLAGKVCFDLDEK